MPNPIALANQMGESNPTTPRKSAPPRRSRWDKYTQELVNLVGQMQEEHDREVDSLRRENDQLQMRIRGEGGTISRPSSPSSPGFAIHLNEDLMMPDPDCWGGSERNWTELRKRSDRSKPRGRAPMGATKVIRHGGNNHQNRLASTSISFNSAALKELGPSPRGQSFSLRSSESADVAAVASQALSSDDYAVTHQSPNAANTLRLTDNSQMGLAIQEVNTSLPTGAYASMQGVGSTMSVGFDPVDDRTGTQALFPRWFNPYVQETYIGERQGNETNILGQIMDKEHRAGARHDRCLLMPIGRPRLAWDLLWCICLLYEMWVTPIDLVFMEDDIPMPDACVVLSRLTMIFFFLDIVLNFFTGYMNGDKEIMNRRKVARNYLRFWFWFDLMATVPWDEIVGGDSSTVSTSRAAKVSKAFKVMKMVKLVRLAKVFHHVENVKRVRFQRALDRVMKTADSGKKSSLEKIEEFLTAFFAPLKHLGFSLQVIAILAITSHAHAIVFALIYDWGGKSKDVDECFLRYYESFWWSWCVFTFRAVPQPTTPELWTLEICVFSERLLICWYALLWLIFKALIWREDDARTSLKNTNAMQYLKQHHVSVKTQVQVLFSVNQCGNIQKTQRNFMDLMENDLPQELQRQICEELWSKHLGSLALILAVSDWRSDFLMELSQLVREETYASKVVVFREGDAAVAAYMVLQGVLLVMSSFQQEGIPDFTKGMWLGEKSLINLGLRRSGTGLTKVVSTLMSVPAAGFQALLDRMELLDKFQQFCSDELWKGLCGRCGTMGSHFGHECPLLPQRGPKVGAKFSLFRSATSNFTKSNSRHGKRESTHLARDIKMYFASFGLERFLSDMEELGIENLDDLQQPENINLFLGRPHTDITDEELRMFTPDAIIDFKSEIAGKARSLLSAKMSNSHHFMFLSHYKVEAGTEAALMRAELEQLIMADEGHPAKDLDSPIFLDSEDLQDLVDLMKAVQKSHNLILMLTKGILTRPWCIVEICTAMREGVSVLPVKITKPGSEFVFPDEQFYMQLARGDVLGEDGCETVMKHGFSMAEVCEAVRRVFKRIAVPYSPHRTSAIRKEELQALLRQCSCREIPDHGHHGDLPAGVMGSQVSEQVGRRPSLGSAPGAGVARMASDGTSALPPEVEWKPT